MDEVYLGMLQAEFPDELDAEEPVYLDHAGATRASRRQLADIFSELSVQPFSLPVNMHAANSLLAAAMQSRTKEARRLTLAHFNASEGEYAVIFTSGATASIKLVGEIFPWGTSSSGGNLCYTQNVHTSALGLRSLARRSFVVPSHLLYKTYADGAVTEEFVVSPLDESTDSLALNLFIYPGECNFSGIKAKLSNVAMLMQTLDNTCHHPLMKRVKDGGTKEYPITGKWLSFLDASKLASSSNIDVSLLPSNSRPDFICASFYKIFGYPSGLGTLLIKKKWIPFMNKRYFGGGTIHAAAVETNMVRRQLDMLSPHVQFEDGTSNFYGILALRHGFAVLNRMGKMSRIESYLNELTKYALTSLSNLLHRNGRQLCAIYGPIDPGEAERGPIISMNLYQSNGLPIGFDFIAKRAVSAGFQLRTGCFCNIGCCQEYLHMTEEDILHNFEFGRTCHGGYGDIIGEKPTGAVRISFGYMTKIREIDKFLTFLKEEFLETRPFLSLDTTTGEVDSVHTSMNYKIKDIYLYPIKSCGGQRVLSWQLSPAGLLYDRVWSILDDTGVVMTQKKYPLMVKIQPTVDIEQKLLTLSFIDENSKSIETISSSFSSFLEDTNGFGLSIRVCGRRTVAQPCATSEINLWLSKILGTPCQLVLATDVLSKASFKNDKPFLVITQESVDKISEISKLSLKSTTFRPNFVIERSFDGVDAQASCAIDPDHDHDSSHLFSYNWKSISINIKYSKRDPDETLTHKLMSLKSCGPCQRCSMINVNDESGKADQSVFQTLMAMSTFSEHKGDIHAQSRGKVYFGEFFDYDDEDGFASFQDTDTNKICIVSSGDSVVVHRN